MHIQRHSITSCPYEAAPFSKRLGLAMLGVSMLPFKRDDRISLLMTAMAGELLSVVENDDQIEAVLDQLRIQMKLAMWRNQL